VIDVWYAVRSALCCCVAYSAIRPWQVPYLVEPAPRAGSYLVTWRPPRPGTYHIAVTLPPLPHPASTAPSGPATVAAVAAAAASGVIPSSPRAFRYGSAAALAAAASGSPASIAAPSISPMTKADLTTAPLSMVAAPTMTSAAPAAVHVMGSPAVMFCRQEALSDCENDGCTGVDDVVPTADSAGSDGEAIAGDGALATLTPANPAQVLPTAPSLDPSARSAPIAADALRSPRAFHPAPATPPPAARPLAPATPPLSSACALPTSTASNTFLVIGGFDGSDYCAATELYTPLLAAATPASTASSPLGSPARDVLRSPAAPATTPLPVTGALTDSALPPGACLPLSPAAAAFRATPQPPASPGRMPARATAPTSVRGVLSSEVEGTPGCSGVSTGWLPRADLPAKRYGLATAALLCTSATCEVIRNRRRAAAAGTLDMPPMSRGSLVTASPAATFRRSPPDAAVAADALGATETYVVAAGGFDGRYTTTCNMYDVARDTWTPIANLPCSTYGAAAATLQGWL